MNAQEMADNPTKVIDLKEKIEANGTVIEALPNTTFRVERSCGIARPSRRNEFPR
jgi:hypothetical protein